MSFSKQPFSLKVKAGAGETAGTGNDSETSAKISVTWKKKEKC